MNIQTEIKDIVRLLHCPVSFEILTTAVTFIPCAHKVQEYIAKALYGEVINGQCSINKLCVVCQVRVIAYYPDVVIRDLAQRVFNLEKPKSHFYMLAAHTSLFDAAKIKDTPDLFPGNSARFVYQSGSFELKEAADGHPAFHIQFKSANAHLSLFQSFEIMGYRKSQGSLRVIIHFKKQDYHSIKTFLELNYFFMGCLKEGCIDCCFKDDVQKLSHILNHYNEIPSPYRQKVIALLDEGLLDTSRRWPSFSDPD